MSAARVILGIARNHDVGASIFSNGTALICAEAERVLDRKHARGADALPAAIEAACRDANVEPADVDGVVLADTGTEIIERDHEGPGPGDPARLRANVIADTHGSRLLHSIGTVGALRAPRLGPIRGTGLRAEVPVFAVCHHAAHAAGSIYMSGFDECVALVVDGYGSCAGTLAYHYRDGTLMRLEWSRDAALLGAPRIIAPLTDVCESRS